MAISIKDFAKLHNVSYEAVRQQIKRYADDLEGHIIKNGRTQYLDEHAEYFLNKKRETNPVVVYEQEKNDQFSSLKITNENLTIKVMQLQEQVIALQASENKLLERASEAEKKLLSAGDLTSAKDKINTLTSELQEATFEKEELRKQVNQLKLEKEEYLRYQPGDTTRLDNPFFEKDQYLHTALQRLTAENEELKKQIPNTSEQNTVEKKSFLSKLFNRKGRTN